ncbi:MAG TPA: ExeA family protein [Desulfobacterales bacterium]
MYLQYWNLKRPPFSNAATDSFFFRSPQHEEALTRLLFAIENRRGVAMLTGEVGCGKTTVTKNLVRHLDAEKYRLQVLCNPALSAPELLSAILYVIGAPPTEASKSAQLAQLQEALLQQAREDIHTVLAIDEAHVIKDSETLDELRMLLNLQYEDQFLITLILLGQPPLLKKVAELQPLKERISVKYHLESLSLGQTLKYIIHRLKQAGARQGFFTREAVSMVHEYSQGIPLRINNTCDRCLLIGYLNRSSVVNTRTVQEALEDLN